jgi:predicted ABC-type ATPase
VSQPVFTLIAGANGAGKSTLTSGNPDTFSASPLLDPDTFAKPLRSTNPSTPIAAGREVLRLASLYLSRGESFSVETTLSGKNYLNMMRTARAKGFDVVLVYIGTEDVEINRIAKRVQGGGHDVPEVDVRRRYRRSFDNLPVATAYADHSLLFDNSSVQGYQLVALLSAAGSQWFEPVPRWAAPLRD